MIESIRNGTQLTVYLSGEIDHCTAKPIREDIEALLSQNRTDHLILDFKGVEFMDSSGVGMVIGRYKTVSARGGMISAAGLHPPIDRLFHMAGLHRILEIIDDRIQERDDND